MEGSEVAVRRHRGGGNIDTRQLVPGSTVSLPVWCEGGLFSCGDPHAAHGDGEVCVSAIERGMRATLRFALRDESIATPRFEVPPRPQTSHGYRARWGSVTT